MKYTPYFIGFMMGISITTLVWAFATDDMRKNSSIIENASNFCSTMGFNSYNIDEHGNVICKNVIKNV